LSGVGHIFSGVAPLFSGYIFGVEWFIGVGSLFSGGGGPIRDFFFGSGYIFSGVGYIFSGSDHIFSGVGPLFRGGIFGFYGVRFFEGLHFIIYYI
tara:strand:- start:41 stop:325 length:285 start_codon:yes stop_codon:yes gene_type:complete